MNRFVLQALFMHGCLSVWLVADAVCDDRIDFSRDIRPILSNHCFQCHGPDQEQRQAELRLDVRASALAPAESGELAIVPGKPDQSQMVVRIFSDDADELMPPPDSKKSLKPREKELLRRWIDQGAEMSQHWAFVAPTRPALPKVQLADWPGNEIDYFTLARMEAQGWTPAEMADRETLIRRLSFDLSGLPPTLKELDAFLSDNDANAYEKVVDRLLNSDYFGERIALDWLDAARFADTNGYHLDNGRDMSAWRAWVIDAFNNNMPYDQFTVEQLAGDLLPDATRQQQIASGFNRNHMINFEGGAIPEEYLTAYIVDRVNTTGAVWLGLTVGCAQCHDHKFDPLTQRDFYGLYAFFNNVPEKGLDGNTGNAMPFVNVPTPQQLKRQAEVENQIAELESKRSGDSPEIDQEQTVWEKMIANAEQLLEAAKPDISLGPWYSVGPMIHPEGAHRGFKLNLGPEDQPLDLQANYSLQDQTYAWQARPEWTDGQLISLAGKHAVNYVSRTIAVTKPTKATLSLGSSDGVKIWLNRKQLASSDAPRQGSPDQHLIDVDLPVGDNELLIKTVDFNGAGAFFFALRANGSLQVPDSIRALAATPIDKRSAQQQGALRGYYRHCVSPNAQLRDLSTQIAELRKKLGQLAGTVRTSMVMRELDEPRDTFMLVRGQYDQKGDRVPAATPAFLPALPQGTLPNRLALARWLVDPSQPLTARVAVNRFWQMFFGVGLVKTSEDLGSQGELPSHPDLLDWLAVEFMDAAEADAGRWNVKALLKKIVMSATYRQTSRVTPEIYRRDPENRLLARGSRFRLPAEFVRDQALAAGGLLRHQIGGPSVNPYQPAGLWQELSQRGDSSNWTAQVFEQSHGDDLYRRSMYTFWKRTSPPPTLTTFDAPDREICTMRRSRTNTPLQALILMNDPTYIEASRALAERLLAEEANDDQRLVMLFRLLAARVPQRAELAALQGLLTDQRQHYAQREDAALELLRVGEVPRNEKLDAREVAAWTMVSSAVLNLDEVVSKN